MHLLIPPEIVERLRTALVHAGSREIGGVLMGEHVGEDTFRVHDLTIQMKGGTFARFVRLVETIAGPLRAFFHATHHRYTKFNYLGEWHSHHSFALQPSGKDHRTMYRMIDDSRLGANFLVLLLVKLEASGELECAVTVYQPATDYYVGEVTQEDALTP